MKVWINSIIFIGTALLYSSCSAQTNKPKSRSIEIDSLSLSSDSIFIAKVSKLNMVADIEKNVGSLEYFVKETPTKDKSYYIIQVGKTNNFRFEIYYTFYCYPKNEIIKLYDNLNDTLIEVDK